jgi:hypothetical protein
MSSTPTNIAHTERLGSNRLVHPPVGPWSVRLGEPGCADATSLVACFMSTGELHERLYAPYGRALGDAGIGR